MISLIICSRNKEISNELKENITSTIGVEYELIVIDNSNNTYNIFEAYNIGISRASGDLLCFMHDDIIFHSDNWGGVIYAHFQTDHKLGILGVVGSHILLDYPLPWISYRTECGQIISGFVDNNGIYQTQLYMHHGRKNGNAIEAAVVDGLWFCIKKEIAELTRFDNSHYNNFHCYDIDICMQVHKLDLSVKVAYDILIEHKSPGCLNNSFWEQLNIWYHKWAGSFPVICGIDISSIELQERELLAKDILSYHEHIQGLYQSKAYRIGKRITAIAKMIKKIIRI